MRSLRILAPLVLLVATVAAPLWAQQSRGVTTSQVRGGRTTTSQSTARGRNGRQAALRDRLTVGLKARTKADRAFVELVVQSVEQGRLPRRLVDGTFLWARKRSMARPGRHKLRPMVYFQPALTLQAKRLGIRI